MDLEPIRQGLEILRANLSTHKGLLSRDGSLEGGQEKLQTTVTNLKKQLNEVSKKASNPQHEKEIRQLALALEVEAVAIQHLSDPRPPDPVALKSLGGIFKEFRLKSRLSSLSSKVNEAATRLRSHKPISTEELRTQLADLESLVAGTGASWDEKTKHLYQQRIANIKASLERLGWEEEAHSNLFNERTQNVFNDQAAVRAQLKQVSGKNGAQAVRRIANLLTKMEGNLQNIPQNTTSYGLAKQALNVATREFATALNNQREKLAPILTQRLVQIRQAEDPAVQNQLIKEFENLWQLLDNDPKRAIQAQPNFAKELPQRGDFVTLCPLLLNEMNKYRNKDPNIVFRHHATTNFRPLAHRLNTAIRNKKPAEAERIVGNQLIWEDLVQMLKESMRFFTPPLLALNDLNVTDAQEIFRRINSREDPLVRVQLQALLLYLNSFVGPKLSAKAIATVFAPAFFGGAATTKLGNREMAKVLEQMIIHAKEWR
jgi:hypothetical protein